jgi:hypothetical protein
MQHVRNLVESVNTNGGNETTSNLKSKMEVIIVMSAILNFPNYM